MKTMADPAVDRSAQYAYRDYRAWPDDERWELIRGEAWMMGAPTTAHQRLVGKLFFMLTTLLAGKPCEAMLSPVDVLLPRRPADSDDEVDTVVQPDLIVVCDPSKVRDKFVRGAPDLVVEILSPSTSGKDQREKFRVYEEAGVREYWIVDPAGKWFERHERGPDGRYRKPDLREPWGVDQSPVPSAVVEGFALDREALLERA
ncbi:MAG: Uma2 family endonuclease [Spirochaetales bacterium]|nr:Uma2 family endonuclease [Spirochaetales bacterium]